MIHVTQGFEQSIGLEVFLKSYLCLPKKQQEKIILYCNLEVLNKYIQAILNSSFNLLSKNQVQISPTSKLNVFHFEKNDLPMSTVALSHALKKIKCGDYLFNLPTRKSELIYNGSAQAGHTEFFRSYYPNKTLSMVFQGEYHHILLITDHIPLEKITKIITTDLIISKIQCVLKKQEYKEVIISGINPHCGENGLLGTEDNAVTKAITVLQKLFPNVTFKGPVAGDSMLKTSRNSPKQLLVYQYHDQGLSFFKSYYGGNSIQRTFGLDFERISVDHGTAEDLLWKNKADFGSALKCLKWALQ